MAEMGHRREHFLLEQVRPVWLRKKTRVRKCLGFGDGTREGICESSPANGRGLVAEGSETSSGSAGGERRSVSTVSTDRRSGGLRVGRLSVRDGHGRGDDVGHDTGQRGRCSSSSCSSSETVIQSTTTPARDERPDEGQRLRVLPLPPCASMLQLTKRAAS